MFEIRFHGRGGQGAVLASKILAKALVEEGKFVKAIPAFGFERRGAPVEAYLRYDDKEFRQITNIYNPDCIVCLDPTLAQTVNIFAGINDNATWIQSTKKSLDQLNVPEKVTRVGLCDGFGLALEVLGRPITNSIMLGVLAKTTGMVTLASLNKAMATTAFRDAVLEKNVEAAKRGYEATKIFDIKSKEASS